MIGISVYLNDLDYNYIESAYENGVRDIFTSFKIIEEDYVKLSSTAYELINYCQQKKINLIADVDEKTVERFNLSTLKDFKNIGLSSIRIDGGITNSEIAQLSSLFKLYLNASDIKKTGIEEQIDFGLKVENCVAMHNFYPLENTGLSCDYFIEKNNIIKQYGIKIAAFIPGNEKLRGPVYNGLPTLERDRGSRPFVAYLKMMEMVDQVFIGDNEISNQELTLIKQLPVINMTTELFDAAKLANIEHIIRPDFNSHVIRISNRNLTAPNEKGYISKLVMGAITIENEHAIERYQGEVQVVKKESPSNRSKTVIGYISTYDLPILELIKPEHKIIFRIKHD